MTDPKTAYPRRGVRWTDDELVELEQRWKRRESLRTIADAFGFSSTKSLRESLCNLRAERPGRVDLPSRPAGAPRSPLGLAASVRDMTTLQLTQRLVALLNDEGTSFIDAILDDDVATPGGAA